MNLNPFGLSGLQAIEATAVVCGCISLCVSMISIATVLVAKFICESVDEYNVAKSADAQADLEALLSEQQL